MFLKADILAVNKIDLLPHVDFDVDRFVAEARKIRPAVEVFRLSCRTGEGVAELVEAISTRAKEKRVRA
ncbi:MAG: hydrogenase nickel incorporation protein HypB, partial [Planctomycetota bacterium]|jgi:hydrogenase nickel incorporation protein HypB